MKLHERFGDRGFHSCIATTFGIDFDAYEGVVLPRLRGAGCNNNLVLMDARMLTHTLESAVVLPSYAGRHYTLNGIESRGVFHSKVILQLGRSSARLIVGSANLTAPGLGGNLEVAGVISCTPDDTAEVQIIASAWRYLRTFIDTGQEALAYQVEWIQRRTRWLFDAQPANAPLALDGGGVTGLVVSNGREGINDQFVKLVDGQAVSRLIVVSPYWDPELSALRNLSQGLKAREIAIAMGGLQPSIPVNALEGIANVGLYDLGALAKNRFAHAKVLIAQTKDADHVLYGSANCTIAALGKNGFGGINEEACLYRRMGPGMSIAALGLSDTLDPDSRIDRRSLPPYALKPEIPLEAALQRYPGRFEATEGRVVWWPSPGFASRNDCVLELLDSEGSILPCRAVALPKSDDGSRKYDVSGLLCAPGFACIRVEDNVSAPAVVVVVDFVRSAIRETRGKQSERIAGQLAVETEEGLWLLEAFDVLAAYEAEDENERQQPVLARHHAEAVPNVSEDLSRTLAYDDFIAGRRLRGDGLSIGRSDFSGSELSVVRHCLNRLLGFDSLEGADAAGQEDSIRAALATQEELPGDWDSDGSDDITRGPISDQKKAEEDRRKVAVRTAATREQIADAVADFNEIVRETGLGISHKHVLRLRVILTIVLAAARPVAPESSSALRPIQVLNSKGGDSWPLLLGKLLFGMFGGKEPAISRLEIKRVHDELPIDMVESWAICFWALNASKAALLDNKSERSLLARLLELSDRVYSATGLMRYQLEGDVVRKTYEALSCRFAERLSLQKVDLQEMHRVAVKRCCFGEK
jgi:hypothetical protein